MEQPNFANLKPVSTDTSSSSTPDFSKLTLADKIRPQPSSLVSKLRNPDYSLSGNDVKNLAAPPLNPQGAFDAGKKVIGAIGSSIKEQAGNLGILFGGGQNSIASKLGQDIQGGANTMAKGGAGNIVKGAVESGFRTAGDVAGTIFAPVGAVLGTITGVASKLFPQLPKQYEAGINWAAQNANKISGVEKMFNYTIKNPHAEEDFGRAMNLLMAASANEKITTKGVWEAAGAIKNVAMGGEKGLTDISNMGWNKTNAQEATKPIIDTMQTAKEFPGAIAEKITPDSAAIMQRVARINPSDQVKFEKMSGGSNVGEYLVNRGIYGDTEKILQQLYDRFSNSKTTADESLATLQGNYKPLPIKTALNELNARESVVSSEGAPSPDLQRIQELTNAYQKNGLTMSDINEVKRLYEKNVKLDYLRQNLPDKVARANNIDTAIREWQFKKADELGLKNLSEINKETQLSRQLLNALGKKEAGMQGNNAITLTDWIMLAGGKWDNIAGFGIKKLLSSKGIQSKIAQTFGGEPTVGQPKAIFKPK